MVKKHKKDLMKNITLIMCTLIGTIVVVYSIGIMLLQSYIKEINNIVSQTIDFYGNELDQQMDSINTQLVNILLNNGHIRKIKETDLKTQNNSIVHSIASQNKLKEQFEALAINYGKEYHFWFYSREKDIFLCTGEDEYIQKEIYKNYIKKMAQEDEIPVTEKRKWILKNVQGTLFLTSTFCFEDNYVGCWTRPERMCISFQEVGGNSVSFFIKDLSTGEEYLEEKDVEYRIFREVQNEEIDGNKNYWKYNFNNANISLGILSDKGMQKNVSLYEALMVVTALIVVVMSIGIFFHFKKYVQKPLSIFSNNLKKFSETGEFEQNNYYEEFENIGNIWRNLEKEIQELKIQVYEEKLEKQKSKIDYLQLQIRPHFYINCLNSIYSMAQLKHTEEIQQLALYVSDYMRSIFRKGNSLILVEEEVKQIVNYVNIHNIMYRYECKCNISIEPCVQKALIPPLILMVFIENCVKYTIGSKSKIEIQVIGKFDRNSYKRIEIQILDNGPGFPSEILQKFKDNNFEVKDDRFQIGIRNTVNRLRLLYGPDASLQIGNRSDGGTYAVIRIPYCNGED